jgi:2-polyprenyl-3-methyl-5-hydroxy-6-metoxy-1,4-benzoquinol methylase
VSIVYMTGPQIVRYYQEFDENARLRGAHGELEFVRSMDLLGRHLPPAPARVLDIGGATGPYSEALAGRGYETHLVDPMENRVGTFRYSCDRLLRRVSEDPDGSATLDW